MKSVSFWRQLLEAAKASAAAAPTPTSCSRVRTAAFHWVTASSDYVITQSGSRGLVKSRPHQKKATPIFCVTGDLAQ